MSMYGHEAVRNIKVVFPETAAIRAALLTPKPRQQQRYVGSSVMANSAERPRKVSTCSLPLGSSAIIWAVFRCAAEENKGGARGCPCHGPQSGYLASDTTIRVG
jgi:hypothetical protein